MELKLKKKSNMYIFGKNGKDKIIKKLRGLKMTFIGMISEHKSFEKIRDVLKKNLKDEINLIYINKKNISNMKSIRFHMIIIDSDLERFKEEILLIENMCKYASYVAINTDINKEITSLKNKKNKIITYGLNQKATVTISSVTESSILIYLQKNFKNREGNTIEIGEKRIEKAEENKLRTYEFLIIYIIFLTKNQTIINETLEKSNFFE